MKVYFFGDSICFGQYVSPHRVWVAQIARRLEEELGPAIVVQSPSVNGNTTRMALERMPHDVQAHLPDLVYIQFGMNDCNHWVSDRGLPRVGAEAFAANLMEIIGRARAAGARRVLLATNHPTPKTELLAGTGFSYQDSNEAYNALVREVASAAGPDLQLVDNEESWLHTLQQGATLTDLLLPDGIHLGSAGHDRYFEFVYPFVERAVRDLS
jgi:lysophospholipase L1-like esterase